MGLCILKCPITACLSSLCVRFQALTNFKIHQNIHFSSCANYVHLFQEFILFIYIFKISTVEFFKGNGFSGQSASGASVGLRDKGIPGAHYLSQAVLEPAILPQPSKYWDSRFVPLPGLVAWIFKPAPPLTLPLLSLLNYFTVFKQALPSPTEHRYLA